MRINNISEVQINKTTNFNARIGIHNNVIPYLKAQATYMSFEKSPKLAQEWATATWNNILKIGERFKKVLNPDTPIVMAADNKAIQSILNNKKTFDGLDGMLVLDGRPMMVPPEIIPVLEHFTQPISFKFGTDSNLAETLAERFNHIPKEIASFFKANF